MANYYASARSNYFKVKDLTAFIEAIKPFPIKIYEHTDGSLCLLSDNDGGWSWYNAKTDEEIDSVELISPHLQDNEVCILLETGAEKLRYLGGTAQAFDNKGEAAFLSLNEIYDRARDVFGPQASITRAEY